MIQEKPPQIQIIVKVRALSLSSKQGDKGNGVIKKQKWKNLVVKLMRMSHIGYKRDDLNGEKHRGLFVFFHQQIRGYL